MRWSLLLLSAAVGFVHLSSVVADDIKPRKHGEEASAAGLDVSALEALDVAMQKQVDEKQVSGVIGLIGRRGRIGYFEVFGRSVVAKDTPMTKDTLFRIYSMTKPMVAVTAMTLWEEGKFKLDDPIADRLPEWKTVSVRRGGETVEAKTPITPRHLMTHSSGLSYDRSGVDLGLKTTLKQFSESLAKKPLNFEPGSNYQYGYSIDILGRYIEAVEGKSLDQVMRERLFDKLDMNDTDFWVKEGKDRSRVAQVYNRRGGELKPAMLTAAVMFKPARMMGGQGLISTAGDYAAFCQMFANKGEFNGIRVLEKETVELMCRNHLSKIRKVYGLGGMSDGKGGYSWGGAAGTKFWIDTKNNAYGVFMIQTWGYKAPTYPVFRKLTDKALRGDG